MTREEKDLLLRDLCARLPYGVKVYHPDYLEPQTLDTIFNFDAWQDGGIQCNVDDVGDRPCDMIYCKPYLRPLSSMTEEEKKEFIEYAGYEIEESVNGRHYEYYLKDFCGTLNNPSVNADSVDWLNAHHFDYRGLIEKGLAISTEEFNPYKN